MPSGDKARTRAAMASDLGREIDRAIESAERNRIALDATRETAIRIVERFTGYRKRIDEALESGVFPPESRDPVLAVFGDLTTIVEALRRQTAKRAEEIPPFVLGLRRARALTDDAERREERVALRAERDEEEEDEYRADLAERLPTRQGNGNKPIEAEETSHDDSRARGEPEEPPATSEPSETVESPVEPPAASEGCSHCGGPISIPTGSDICVACASHRNRYGALPSARALTNRRARGA